jgi:uncharacterized HAD superfamily protein
MNLLKIGIDIDGVISSEYSDIFRILTQCFNSSDKIEVFIVSSRNNSEQSRKATAEELRGLGIDYDHLIITDDKQEVVSGNQIQLMIDNEDEAFQEVGPVVCCLKVREQGNYCYKSFRWIGSDKTVKQI